MDGRGGDIDGVAGRTRREAASNIRKAARLEYKIGMWWRSGICHQSCAGVNHAHRRALRCAALRRAALAPRRRTRRRSRTGAGRRRRRVSRVRVGRAAASRLALYPSQSISPPLAVRRHIA
jgi:hypothetical protein